MRKRTLDALHRIYHWIENLIRILIGENAQYIFIYFMRTGRRLHLTNPRDINEKLFWVARYWRDPLMTQCADKYLVRRYLEAKGCGDILNELYGVYERAEDIRFDELPQKFVLKCNHGSHMNVICEDKTSLDVRDATKRMNKWLRFQYGRGTEWQYKAIKRRIVAEKYLESRDGRMMEYQVFCFNGKPEFFLVRNDLRKSSVDMKDEQFAVSYTIDWQRVYMRKNEELYRSELPKPHNYDKMIDYAVRLSEGFPHVRVDFYEIDDRLVFGELTFSSNGGILSNYKDEYVKSLGEMFDLPAKREMAVN